jgi:adenine-specific DNA-methyltransferase
VEVGNHFDEVLKPRILKAAYASEWRGGKPKSHNPALQWIKVIRLESYEDTLNNLELHRAKEQQETLDLTSAQGADKLEEQYLLRYMLDVETRDSQSLLNIGALDDPTSYKLKVKRPGSDESRLMNVDLLETFNWLIGLTVQHIAAPRTFSASFKRDDDKDLPKDLLRRLVLDGNLKEDPSGPWWFRTVTGTTPEGRRTLIIWRKRPGGDSPEGVERDNLVLDEWFKRQHYSSKDSEFDLIYVNCGNNLENLRAPDDTWKVRLIEEDFRRLMFETDGL